MRTHTRILARFVVCLSVVSVFAGCAIFDNGEPITTVLPPADAEPGRWIVLDGANNTRDIGGYPTQDGRRVRWNAVYRSGELSGLTPAGCEAFAALGIHHVIDFRNRVASSPLFGGDAVCVFNVATVDLFPVSTDDSDPAVPAYVATVAGNADSYRRAFELVADRNNLPLLCHCAAGKDRTGVMTALLLTLLGVDRPTVMADYGLSDFVGATTNPQAMTDLLDEVDRQGGIETYLAAIGVSPATQTAIRDALTRPSQIGRSSGVGGGGRADRTPKVCTTNVSPAWASAGQLGRCGCAAEAAVAA